MAAYLTAAEAAAELGITTSSLYAYVSRGLIRSTPRPGSRSKLYAADDVRALSGRGSAALGAAASAIQGGGDAIETALTLIAGGRLFYRGHDAATLASTQRLEAVATLLWDCGANDPFAAAADFVPIDGRDEGDAERPGLISRLIAGLAVAGERDLAGYARTPDAIARTGARILTQVTRTVAGWAAAPGVPVHEALATAWARPEAATLIRKTLVMLADHELAASTYAVRVTASTGASPWRAVTAGLATLDGPRHGGAGARVQALLASVPSPEAADRVIGDRLRAGESVPGFGHPLYPEADPRAVVILDAVRAMPEARPALAVADAVADSARRLIGRAPTVDFALAVAARAARLPDDAPLALFATARTVGWIGHVLEQTVTDRLIRPRARYVGAPPD